MTDADLRKVLEVLAGSEEVTSRLLEKAHGCEPKAILEAVARLLASGRVVTMANPKIEVIYLRITDAGRAWLAAR